MVLKMSSKNVSTEGCMPTIVGPSVWQYLHFTLIDLVS